MLQQITLRQFFEWRMYAQHEPFGEMRADYRAAMAQALLANIHRDRKKRAAPFQVEEFLLTFGAAAPKRTQTVKQQKRIALMLARAANAETEKKAATVARKPRKAKGSSADAAVA
jgi:hypothetical protein